VGFVSLHFQASEPLRPTRCSVLRELSKSIEVRFDCQPLFSKSLSALRSRRLKSGNSAICQNNHATQAFESEALRLLNATKIRIYPVLRLAVAWVWGGWLTGFANPGALTTAVKRLDCAPACRQRLYDVLWTQARSSFATCSEYIRNLLLATRLSSEPCRVHLRLPEDSKGNAVMQTSALWNPA
jgi:hypothetical protein